MPSKVLLKKIKDAERIEKIDEHPKPFVNHDHSLTFPEKLMIMLLDDRNSKAIGWNHDGTQFSIRNRELLCSEVLPHYFRSTTEIKYGSFARKLSRWHFTRTSSGLDTRIYFHHLFLRDKPSLCSQMTCKGKADDAEPVESRVLPCKKECLDPQTNSPRTSDNVPEDIQSAHLPTICSTKYMYNLLFSGCKINRMGKLAVFAQLRHDASILYDYPTKDISSHLQTEKFFSDSASTTSAATTQAVIDAALVAMQRCEDAVSKTERYKALARRSNLLLHERDRLCHSEDPLCGGTEFGSSDLLRALILSAKAKEKFWSSLPLGILHSNIGNNNLDLMTTVEKHKPIEIETGTTSEKADVIPDDTEEGKAINSECVKESHGDFSIAKRPLSERDNEHLAQSPKRTKPNQ